MPSEAITNEAALHDAVRAFVTEYGHPTRTADAAVATIQLVPVPETHETGAFGIIFRMAGHIEVLTDPDTCMPARYRPTASAFVPGNC